MMAQTWILVPPKMHMKFKKYCMFQNMLAILCGWAWNEKLQEEAMVLHLGDACCKSFKNFRKNKKMKGVKEHIMCLHPIWIHKSFVLTTQMEVGEELILDRRGNIQDSHVFLILIHHIQCAKFMFSNPKWQLLSKFMV